MRRQRLGGAECQVAFRLARQRGVGLVDPGMDADLVAVVGGRAHLLGMQQRRHRGIEERRRHRLALQQLADARHGLAVAVLALADAHRAFVGVAQRDRLVIRVEADRHRAARAVRPGLRLQAASGAGTADDAPPGGLGPLPGLAFGVSGLIVHRAPLLLGSHRYGLRPCCAGVRREDKHAASSRQRPRHGVHRAGRGHAAGLRAWHAVRLPRVVVRAGAIVAATPRGRAQPAAFLSRALGRRRFGLHYGAARGRRDRLHRGAGRGQCRSDGAFARRAHRVPRGAATAGPAAPAGTGGAGR